MKSFLKEYRPSVYLCLILVIAFVASKAMGGFGKDYFIKLSHSLQPDDQQLFVICGIIYFVALLALMFIGFILKIFNALKIHGIFTKLSRHILDNLSQPVKGFYQACSGLLFFGFCIGLKELSQKELIVLLVYALIYGAVPTFIRMTTKI